ncbi:RHS repeat-associated core domain-containing protein [Lysobacter sp. K5869]|uniref:RHS repeat domain-containing protein n=1 Tax=Lysobacter sp. K5869 TaxID=2820808 RepID=UPI001C06228C|nr:RHS repeat-associated core domain-containing protein [Lysobacter sp. K5869]QWP75389.1 RHS repeat-associated core domain-containing protein [Lysobacter sp. K5869]
MSAPSGSSVPSIRTFQMDASTVGVLKSSVNLFRGDVNHTQTLFSLPGRSDNDGLQIDLSIQYQSNVNRQAMGWNRDQPTGVLGLGWTLPLASIRMEDGNCPTPALRKYSIAVAGNSSAMVRDPQAPLLFAMDKSLAAQLRDGAAVPAAIRGVFVDNGVPLSAGAVVVGAASPWTLRDDALEQEFVLTLGATLDASDGGETYQLVNYRFWRVQYFPRYERWAVTNEAGQRMSFGGGLGATDKGYRTSAGNSVEWGVQWLDAHGVPVWQGSSARAQGQSQYACAWHLQRVYSRFGESVSYEYNCFERGGDGLLPKVEQLVAAGGLPYTKACYLGRIVDVYGRSAEFAYGDKLWSAQTAASPREYADPHKDVPDTAPNGFQDRYETLFLDRIDVRDRDGGALFAVDFDYQPVPGSPVANVAGDSGDTCKRLLTAVRLLNADGDSLPGYRYGYYLDVKQGGNLAALASIDWPTGGVARYEYASASLPICDRSLAVSAPSPMPAQSIPRVWFGPDYAVVLWNNTADGRLAMQIFTWTGQWMPWQADPHNALLLQNDSGGTALSSVAVDAGQDFVAVSYQTSADTAMHLFRKDMARPGQWVAAAIPGGGNGGCNSPTWRWPLQDGTVQTAAGASYVFAWQSNPSALTCKTDLFTWNWPSQSWQHDHRDGLGYRWFAHGADYLASVDLNSHVSLDWIDAVGAWHSAPGVDLGFRLNSLDALALAGDASLLAISHKIAGSPGMGEYSYDVWLLQWNRDYVFAAPTQFSFKDRFDSQWPTSWAPSAIGNSLVAVAANVMRFDGAQWSVNSALAPSGIVGGEQRYGYGPDYAVQVMVPSVGAPQARLIGYDPGKVGFGSTAPISGLSTPQSHPGTANWIGAGSPDYLAVGTQLFFRGTASDWGRSVGNAIANLQTLVNQGAGGSDRYQLNSASLLNEGPAFLACALYDAQDGSGHATAASALVLRNGGVQGAAQILDRQAMWTPQEQDQPSQGTSPGGPMAFFSYPSDAGRLDAATTVYLNRYAGDAVLGPISDWPVSAITIDDGLSESFATAYVPDTANAACDASGQVVKYFQTAVYPGGSPQQPVNGSVVSRYLNGNADVTGADWYNMLDGLLHSVTTLDAQGKTLNATEYEWTAYVQRASDPNDPAAPVRQLYGAYALQTAQQQTSDGVASRQTTSYIPDGFKASYTGQPATVSSQTVRGDGRIDAQERRYRYACEAYPQSRTINDVSSVVEQSASQAGVATAISATALAQWASAWGEDVKVMAEAADFAWTGGAVEFPFGAWQPGQTPANWQAMTQLQTRAPDGTVLQNADGADVPCTTLYADPAFGLPVAVFRGAVGGECAWSGFQSYESTAGWSLSGTRAEPSQAWLGEQSLALKNGGRIATAVAPGASRTRYLFGLRYLTPAGYIGGRGAIKLDPGQNPLSLDLDDTQGQWRYLTASVDLPAGCKSLALSIDNPGSAEALIDGVLLIPFGVDATVQSWQADTRLLLASMSATGACDFNRYDRFNRPLGAVAANGQWQELDQRFQSRQGNAGDRFDDASPNAELTLQFAAGGITETFRDGNGWQTRWAPGDAAHWSCAGGELLKAGTDSDTLTWQRGSDAEVVAFFVELQAQGTAAGTLSLRFGDGETIAWTVGKGWSWTDAKGGTVQAPLAAPPHLAQQWLLLLGGGQTLFFGDGQLLFSAARATEPSAGCAFATGPNALRISQLGYGGDPRLGLSYSDGAARQRQVHQRDGGDSRIMASVYDALDRSLAGTKTAPGSFGSGANAPMLSYRPCFLDVAAFLRATADTWKMQGDIADYYAGQRDGGAQRSDDQGYPYRGSRYESSAQSRVVEYGQPGKELAIHDILSVPESARHTMRTAYGASDASDPVAAGAFYATDTTTPGGYQARQLVDTSQRATAMLQADPQGGKVGQSVVGLNFSAGSDDAGILGRLQLPNAFTTSPQSNPPAFVRDTLTNPLGQAVQYQDPDTGVTLSLYNGKGQLRFVQPALDNGQTGFLYTRYDALGRISEEGAVAAAWNRAALIAQLDNPDWPSAADGAVAGRSYRYDGDGSDPNALGRLIQTTTYNPDPGSGLGDCTVVESWSYDAHGNVVAARLQVGGAATLDASARYAYNNLNEVVRIDLPAGSPLAAITYAYDDQGHIVAIGVPGDEAAIARYGYNAEGQLQSAQRGRLSELWNYDSPGCVLSHRVDVDNAPAFAQTFAYTPDSQIQQRTTAQAQASTDIGYAYDGQQRLASATVAGGGAGTLKIDSYDANGNIWAATVDGSALSTPCHAGNDRLASAQSGSGPRQSFQYDASGRPTDWRGLSLRYDAALASVSTVAAAGADTVRYARGLNNQRVLRQQGAHRRLYFCGAGSTPLMVWNDGKPQLCVWGPDGLVAVHDGRLQYPVSDHQHSVWAVFDDQGQALRRFDYAAFGAPLAAAGDDWWFLYAGKEYDAGTGLYDFGARLYDPALMRFLGPDPARQFSSPYVFASNNPINYLDPSGNISVWAQVGIGAAMAVLAIAGIALSVVTFGAAAPAVAGGEAALAGATVAGEGVAAGAALAEGGGLAAGAVAAEGAIEGAAGAATAAAAEVGAGAGAAAVETAVPLTTAQVIAQNAISVAWSATTGAISGAGTGGLAYDIQHGRDFTAKGFFSAMGLGALGGAIGGGFSGLATMPATVGLSQGMSIGGTIAFRALTQGVAGMVGQDVSTLVCDAISGQKITAASLLMSSLQGFGTGAASGTFSAVSNIDPSKTAVNAVERAAVRAGTTINKAIDGAKSMATSQGAIGLYVAGGFLLAGGYAAWGAASANNQN